MQQSVSIAVIGDYNFSINAHRATNLAFGNIEAYMDVEVNSYWIASEDIGESIALDFEKFDGVFVAPGPYKAPMSILKLARYCRQHGVPFLGTDYSFKIVLLEFLEDIVGQKNILSEEAVVQNNRSEDANSFLGKEITIEADSILKDYCLSGSIRELCGVDFKVSDLIKEVISKEGLMISGRDSSDEVVLLEAKEHPYYISAVYLPQLNSTENMPNPLIKSFVHALVELEHSKRSAS